MELLQHREQEIFATLKKIQAYTFVVVGGYAVNAYTLPRFSTDCDIVIKEDREKEKIEKELVGCGYIKEEYFSENFPYHGNFARYVKKLSPNFKVSMDLLIKEVIDRRTQAGFTAEWVFEQAELRQLRGKTITENLKLTIINPEALVIMKFISCRNTDIRDIFMLAPLVKNISLVQDETAKRADFQKHFLLIKEKIISAEFRNNLQGVYGYIDDKTFKKHQQAVLAWEQS